MLRIERTGKDEWSLRLRPRGKFLNRPLLRGLGVALLFHLTLWIALDLRPPPSFIFHTRPPAIADVDLGIDQRAPSPLREELAMPSVSPTLPSVEASSLQLTSPSIKPKWRRELPITRVPRGALFSEHYRPIRIALRGPLSGRTLRVDPTDSPTLRTGPTEKRTIAYRVQIEERSGQILTYTCLADEALLKQKEKAERILADLRIESKPGAPLSRGIVEITFEWEKE